MSTPLDALDEQAAGEALREAADRCWEEMAKAGHSQSPWEDAIGTERRIFERFNDELRARGFEIVRTR
jgi:hypothetical protein